MAPKKKAPLKRPSIRPRRDTRQNDNLRRKGDALGPDSDLGLDVLREAAHRATEIQNDRDDV